METSDASGTQEYRQESFRVTIIYSDNEVFGRVFKDREKAERYAARQKKSPVVKKTKIVAFIKDRHEWHKARAKRQDKTTTLK
jgi:hypothetical protein